MKPKVHRWDDTYGGGAGNVLKPEPIRRRKNIHHVSIFQHLLGNHLNNQMPELSKLVADTFWEI